MLRAHVLVALVAAAVLVAGQPHAIGQSAPATLRVAAASDLQSALPDLLGRFETETGTTVAVSYGSSGNFFAQIQNGAPFDIFFSADVDYPRRLIAAGHADADTLYHYATGRIVVWARKDSAVPIARGLSALLDAGIRRVAMANPDHAPYGRAAVSALKHEQIYDAVRHKLVLGENISQTAQLVDSGNADAGIVALSLALGSALSASGTYAEIPASAHSPIAQALVVVSASRHKPATHALIAFLKRPEIRQRLQQFGFGVGQ